MRWANRRWLFWWYWSWCLLNWSNHRCLHHRRRDGNYFRNNWWFFLSRNRFWCCGWFWSFRSNHSYRFGNMFNNWNRFWFFNGNYRSNHNWFYSCWCRCNCRSGCWRNHRRSRSRWSRWNFGSNRCHWRRHGSGRSNGRRANGLGYWARWRRPSQCRWTQRCWGGGDRRTTVLLGRWGRCRATATSLHHLYQLIALLGFNGTELVFHIPALAFAKID